jgi:hypothetical protein
VQCIKLEQASTQCKIAVAKSMGKNASTTCHVYIMYIQHPQQVHAPMIKAKLNELNNSVELQIMHDTRAQTWCVFHMHSKKGMGKNVEVTDRTELL